MKAEGGGTGVNGVRGEDVFASENGDAKGEENGSEVTKAGTGGVSLRGSDRVVITLCDESRWVDRAGLIGVTGSVAVGDAKGSDIGSKRLLEEEGMLPGICGK